MSPSENIINVQYCRGNNLITMGRLALKDRKFFFEYSPSFIETGLELSPFKLALQSGVIACEDPVFEGLFGIFNDSLPDGWGRLLLDRKLMKMGINPGSLTALDRLRYVGTHGMGALRYIPEIEHHTITQSLENLDLIAEECLQLQDNDDDEFVDDLLELNGSSAGARPKILVTFIDKHKKIEMTQNEPNTSKDDWIIKFRSSLDAKDIGCIEYAYHLMALQSGLDVPKARLFKSNKCNGYFGVQRFDHQKSKFLHMHSMSGLLHIDHRIPSFDYETLMKATLWLTKDVRECVKQFRHAVFNIFSHNRDDHAKNFSFLMNEEGIWKVSPSYDLNFSFGPAGEHCTTIMGEGKYPDISHLLQLANVGQIKKSYAMEIIEQVKTATANWPKFAHEAGVTKKSTGNIQKELLKISSYTGK